LISTGSAPDGEEYFATALIFAAKRWGDGAAPLNYSVQAADVHAVETRFDPQRGYLQCPACGAAPPAGAAECPECGLGLGLEGAAEEPE